MDGYVNWKGDYNKDFNEDYLTNMAKADILAKIAARVSGQGNQLGIADIADILTDIVNLADGGASLETVFAPAYSATSTYTKDELCTHEGKLYYAKANISTAEAWTASHWTETNVKAQLALKADKV